MVRQHLKIFYVGCAYKIVIFFQDDRNLMAQQDRDFSLSLDRERVSIL